MPQNQRFWTYTQKFSSRRSLGGLKPPSRWANPDSLKDVVQKEKGKPLKAAFLFSINLSNELTFNVTIISKKSRLTPAEHAFSF